RPRRCGGWYGRPAGGQSIGEERRLRRCIRGPRKEGLVLLFQRTARITCTRTANLSCSVPQHSKRDVVPGQRHLRSDLTRPAAKRKSLAIRLTRPSGTMTESCYSNCVCSLRPRRSSPLCHCELGC